MTAVSSPDAVAAPMPDEIRLLCLALGLAPPREILSADFYAAGRALPWQAKLAAKLVLARLPLGYAAWRRLGLFRHGATPTAIEPRRAVFDHHVSIHGARRGTRPKTIIEIGPGDSVATAIFAHANDATATLIDAGDFATGDMDHYRAIAAVCGRAETRAIVEHAPDRDSMLAHLGAHYLTDGVASLESMAPHGIDLIFSNAVVEHIPRNEMQRFFAAAARALGPRGIASHGIDLHDHLGGKLNHWRFSARVWESELFRRSGFYTNRLPFSAVIALARAAGFTLEIPWIRTWSRPPIAAESIHPDIAYEAAGDRSICSFGLILDRTADATATCDSVAKK